MMVGQLELELARGSVPDADFPVLAAGGANGSIFVEGDASNRKAVLPFEDQQGLIGAGGEIIEANAAVGAAGRAIVGGNAFRGAGHGAQADRMMQNAKLALAATLPNPGR